MFQQQPPGVFYKKVILKIFTKFTEKPLSRSLFLIKLQVPGLQLKTPTQLFSSEFWAHFKKTFCIKHHWVAASVSTLLYQRVFTWDPKWNLPETKFQPTIKQILFTLLFIAGGNKWISFRGWPKINGPLSKNQYFLFTHVQVFPFIWVHFG